MNEVANPQEAGDKKDLLEHARFIHFSVIAFSLTLILVLSGDSPNHISQMASEVGRLDEVIMAIPAHEELVRLGWPSWNDCIRDPNTWDVVACLPDPGLDGRLDELDELGENLSSRYLDTGLIDAMNQPANLRQERNPGFEILDAELLWSQLDAPARWEYWVIDDYFVLDCQAKVADSQGPLPSGTHGKNERENTTPPSCDVLSLTTTPRSDADERKFRFPNTRILTPDRALKEISAENLALLPQRRQGGDYSGWLLATNYDSSRIIVAPLYRYSPPSLVIGRLIVSSKDRPEWFNDWRKFAEMFPALATAEPRLKMIPLSSAKGVLEAIGEQYNDRELSIFGMELRVRNVSLVGILVLLAILTYFLLHLEELGKRIGSEVAVAWIAVYDSKLAKLVTILSFLVPVVAAGYVALNAQGGEGSNWVIWILAGIAAIVTLCIYCVWLKFIMPRTN